jgi:hypothetical protein
MMVLGNSVLGEWCNIGADSNNSNLKNNYEEVKLWSYETEVLLKLVCSLWIDDGDHSKCGINTMFNTGTVIGVSANIFGLDFHVILYPVFLGWSFWIYHISLKKAFETARLVMAAGM